MTFNCHEPANVSCLVVRKMVILVTELNLSISFNQPPVAHKNRVIFVEPSLNWTGVGKCPFLRISFTSPSAISVGDEISPIVG